MIHKYQDFTTILTFSHSNGWEKSNSFIMFSRTFVPVLRSCPSTVHEHGEDSLARPGTNFTSFINHYKPPRILWTSTVVLVDVKVSSDFAVVTEKTKKGMGFNILMELCIDVL
jgi:hypothetical protein